MDFNRAINILELNRNFNEKDLKQAYYKKALLSHPDKNKDTTGEFIQINRAYLFLQKNNKSEKTPFLYTIDIVYNFIYNKDFLKKLTKQLSKENLIKILNFLKKYEKILNIKKEVISFVYSALVDKLEKNTIYILNPSIDDMIDGIIFKLNTASQVLFCPLWLDEIRFDDAKYIIKCIPLLDENIIIDKDNNIICKVNKKIETLLYTKHIDVNIGKKLFKINIDELKIKKRQKYILKNLGMPLIDTNNSYNKSNLGDIIFDIYLS